MHALIGRTIGKYKVLDHLASGASADVFKALQTGTERLVALKILRPLAADDSEAKSLDRFLQEARTIAKLEHPNILTVHEVGEADGTRFLAMRYVGNGTLRERMNLRRPFTLMDARRVLLEIGGALDHAHEHKVIHRDVKPENVLVDSNATHLLTDFGIAMLADQTARLTQLGQAVGTAFYMSPEQARGQMVDGRSDLYSLAAVVFEMLTGEPPIVAANLHDLLRRKLEEPIRFPDTMPTGVPLRMRKAILHALEIDPRDRPTSAKALLDEFDRALTDEGEDSRERPSAARSQPRTPASSRASASAEVSRDDPARRRASALPAGRQNASTRGAPPLPPRRPAGSGLFYASAVAAGMVIGTSFDRIAPTALATLTHTAFPSPVEPNAAESVVAHSVEPPPPVAEIPTYAVAFDASITGQTAYAIPERVGDYVVRPLASRLKEWSTFEIPPGSFSAAARLSDGEIRNQAANIDADVVILLAYELVSLAPEISGRYRPVVRLTGTLVDRGGTGPLASVGPLEGEAPRGFDDAAPGIHAALANCSNPLLAGLEERMASAREKRLADGRCFDLEVVAQAAGDALVAEVRSALDTLPGVTRDSIRLTHSGSRTPVLPSRRDRQNPPAAENRAQYSFRFSGDPNSLITDLGVRLDALLGSDPTRRVEFSGNRIRMFGSGTSLR